MVPVDQWILSGDAEIEVTNEKASVRIPEHIYLTVGKWIQEVMDARKSRDLSKGDFGGCDRVRNEMQGKLGEIAVCCYYNDLRHACSLPDWEIYETGTAYRDPDIGGFLHVKTANHYDKYDPTWMAESDDLITHEVPLDGEELALCVAHGYVMIDIVARQDVSFFTGLWKDPILDRFKEMGKVGIYWPDILERWREKLHKA